MRKFLIATFAMTLAALAAGDATANGIGTMQVAQALSAPLRIEIVSRCEGNDGVFTVRNVSGHWPSTVKLSAMRINDSRVIKVRRTFLGEGKEAHLTIHGIRQTGIEVGLKIESNWAAFMDRPVAPVRCSADRG